MAAGFFADEQLIVRTGRPLIDRDELALDRFTGTVRHISTSKIPLRDKAGNVVGIVGIGRDITERKLADERIRHLATHDSLTELPNQDASDLKQIDAVAARMVRSLTAPLQLLDHECRVSASVGIAIFPIDGDSERALMKSADIAMYTAKQEGKNNYRFFSSRLKTESLERVLLENELRHAIARNEFLIHYLAKFDLKTRSISGAEALLRWHHPDLGIIAPARFIPLAEETGLIVPIGAWMLKAVCAQHMAWQREGFPSLCMSVNLAPRQFHDEHLVATVLSALAESGMAANMLELEISEATLMQDSQHTAATLASLRRSGVRVAIDNFGASYVSLANIQRYPINTLKIDRSLMRDMDQNAEKSLSVTVIAAGVETRRQAAFLREQACDAMQGFYVNEPSVAADFTRLLHHQAQMCVRKPE